MSTKTSIKRIALVAVSALGFGLVSSVAPASAAASLTAVTPSNNSVFRAASDSYQLTISASEIADGTRVYATWLASADTDNTLLSNLPGIDAGGANTEVETLAEALTETQAAEDENSEDVSGWVFAAATTAYSTVGVAAGLLLHIDETEVDTAGDYSIRIWADIDASGTFTAADASVIKSWTMGGAIDSASCSFSPSSVIETADTATVLACTVTDADGNPTREIPGTDDIEWSTADYAEAAAGATGNGQADTALTETIGNTTLNGGSGVYTDVLYVGSDAAAAIADGSRDAQNIQLDNADVELIDSADLLFYVYDPSATEVTLSVPTQTGVYASGVSVSGTARTVTVAPSVSTVYFTISSGTATKYTMVTTANVAAAPAIDMVHSSTFKLIGADGTHTFAITNPTPVADESVTVTAYVDGTGDPSFTVTWADDEPTLSKYAPDASFSAKTGSSNTLTVIAKDAYGVALSGAAVTVTVAGRNPGNATATTTDANGLASFTLKDTSTATITDFPTDTVTFTVTDADGDTATASYTITYSTTGPVVGSITLTETSGNGSGDNDADGDRIATIDPVVSLGSAASTSYVTVTAQLKGTTGAPLGAGVVVTFSGGADDLFGTTATVATMKKTLDVTTASNGQAVVYVYRTKTGSTTVTATAAGVSGSTAALIWETDDAYARTITISADPASAPSEGIVKVIGTVTDRYGNPVPGVDTTFAETGTGRLYGTQDTLETTNANGQVFFDVTSLKDEVGTNLVTIAVTETGTQVSDPINKVAGTTVAGVEAGVSTASMTVEFTKNTSVSTSDALLELAKAIGTGKDVESAADAALEAIDAANAATDAANLAAEAADAATVAAEEARDAADAATAAVEELATQVASLMSALKAQLTTLSNTVAKIAKKVKA